MRVVKTLPGRAENTEGLKERREGRVVEDEVSGVVAQKTMKA